ncbi:MAG: hypothetical protein K2G38_05725 [Clostridia bacterium]|nr:hypothetical protein [Clostridia bacterium]
MKNDKAHFVAFIGVMFALIFVLFLLEGAVLSGLGMTACILSLPVAIALSIYDDWKKSFIGGMLLGFGSCIFCLIFASAFIFYANPLISVLPRCFIGITAYWTYFGLSKLLKKVKNKYLREALPAAIAGVVGSLTNTVLYLLAVNIWTGSFNQALSAILSIAVTIYFPIELAACFVLVPVYVAVLKKVSHKYIDKKPLATEAEEQTEENNNEENQNTVQG